MTENEPKTPYLKGTNYIIQAAVPLGPSDDWVPGMNWQDAGLTSEGIEFKALEADAETDFVANTLTEGQQITVTTKLEYDVFDRMNALIRGSLGERLSEQERFLRSVLLVGVAPAPHRHPGALWRSESRVSHTRARKLYSERLRRDRRAIRKGRKPILRTTNIRGYFPRAEMSLTGRLPNGHYGMRVIPSPYLEPGKAVVFDPDAMNDAIRNMGAGFRQFGDSMYEAGKSAARLSEIFTRGHTPTAMIDDEAAHFTDHEDNES